MKSILIATILSVAAAAPVMNAPVDVDALATTSDMALARHFANTAIFRRQKGGDTEEGGAQQEEEEEADEETGEPGEELTEEEQGELAFQAAVEECQIKLAAGRMSSSCSAFETEVKC